MGKRFVMLGNFTSNTALSKDLGMIPFILKKYYGYDAAYTGPPASDDLSLLSTTHAGFEVIEFGKILDENTERVEYIKNNARNIDILGIAGAYRYYDDIISLYKELNPSGKVYCKLDMNVFWLSRFLPETYYPYIKKIDLMTAESKEIVEHLNQQFPCFVDYIPNGYYPDFFPDEPLAWEEKENSILTVGRLGTELKGTEVLLQAFALAAGRIPDWNLLLVGSIADTFQPYIEAFFDQHPHLRDRIRFTGVIAEKPEMQKVFSKAKIFTLPSVVEAMCHVYFEALQSGCVVISSNIEGASEITDNESHGALFPEGDAAALSYKLVEVALNEEYMKIASIKGRKYVEEHYNWIKIGRRLDIFFQQLEEKDGD